MIDLNSAGIKNPVKNKSNNKFEEMHYLSANICTKEIKNSTIILQHLILTYTLIFASSFLQLHVRYEVANNF